MIVCCADTYACSPAWPEKARAITKLRSITQFRGLSFTGGFADEGNAQVNDFAWLSFNSEYVFPHSCGADARDADVMEVFEIEIASAYISAG